MGNNRLDQPQFNSMEEEPRPPAHEVDWTASNEQVEAIRLELQKGHLAYIGNAPVLLVQKDIQNDRVTFRIFKEGLESKDDRYLEIMTANLTLLRTAKNSKIVVGILDQIEHRMLQHAGMFAYVIANAKIKVDPTIPMAAYIAEQITNKIQQKAKSMSFKAKIKASVENTPQFLADTGLLGEINRRVMHPKGLALAYNLGDGVASGLHIYQTEDPAGFIFDEELLPEIQSKLNHAEQNKVWNVDNATRLKKYGEIIQKLKQGEQHNEKTKSK